MFLLDLVLDNTYLRHSRKSYDLLALISTVVPLWQFIIIIIGGYFLIPINAGLANINLMKKSYDVQI